MKPAAEVRRDLAAIDTRPRRCHVCNAWLPDGPCEHFPERWLPTPAAEARERLRASARRRDA